METLLYFGKVNLYWILFYTCYWLLFRKHTFFVWNRTYLVGSLLISFLLPLISIPETEQTAPTVFYTVSTVAAVPLSATKYTAPETFDLTQWIWPFLALGSFFMLRKLIKSFWHLNQIIAQGEQIKLSEYNLILLSDNKTGSFSFLKWLVLNRYDYENNPDPILRHEMVHMRQMHSLDILLIEIIKVIFWFNPVIWFYKTSLQEVHEYLADEAAPNRDYYARFLVSYSLSVPVTLLTNHFFNSSTLKSRIKMIYKNRNSRWILGKYLMIVPVLLFALLLTAAREKLTVTEEVQNLPASTLYNESEITENSAVVESIPAIVKSDTGKVKVNIEGDILRESGLGIADVNIFDPERDISVTTDPLGRFKMTNVDVGGVLVVSHVSYIPQILVVEKGKTKYTLTFKNGQNELKGPEFTATQDVSKITEERKKKKEIAESLSSVKEQKPQFPGGEEALAKYIESNIRYPEEAVGVSAGGIALVSFTINSNGDVRKPKVVKEIGWGIDDEAVRLVLNMPRWEPARQNGHPVAMEYMLSIRFNLKREVSAKARYQGNYPADNQNSKYHYFNYKMPDTPVLANQDNVLTKAFDFSNDKKPEVKVPAIQLRIYKPAEK
ncbi:energy transducer TonB [Dyadobacter subterraneus]|uniref:M56 family metallopeptidase n=1 Tax=Dyadobacter subterraneus TaxID=2773304 RepID=A0ABR9WLG5_9BACT|nr:M56 family metallopeptidase [Dyadobacter subterraneus]MBE9466355.1 M56 family metallopeptidase [Dyadobacter subterraneus]